MYSYHYIFSTDFTVLFSLYEFAMAHMYSYIIIILILDSFSRREETTKKLLNHFYK